MKMLTDFLVRFNELLVSIEKTALFLVVTAMVGASFLQVVLRNTCSFGFVWMDEGLKMGVLWAAFLGAVLATEYQSHLSLDILTQGASPRNQRRLQVVAALALAAVCTLLLVAAVQFIKVVSKPNGGLLADAVPTWWFHLIIPYFCAVSVFRSGLTIFGLRTHTLPQGPHSA